VLKGWDLAGGWLCLTLGSDPVATPTWKSNAGHIVSSAGYMDSAACLHFGDDAMACRRCCHACQVVMKSEERQENIQDLNSRTAAFSADGEIDTAATYQLPGLELVGHT
jgi:hypothetical protein